MGGFYKVGGGTIAGRRGSISEPIDSWLVDCCAFNEDVSKDLDKDIKVYKGSKLGNYGCELEYMVT